MKVVDFRTLRSGTLVRRSAHYFKSRSHGKDHPDRKQLGIVTGAKFFEDEIAGVICYPIIHWEGSVSDSMTHPSLAVPARRGVAVKYVEVAG